MELNLCIPIPIRDPSIVAVKPVIDKALSTKPNLIELRFDYVTDYKSISMEFLKNLTKIISPHATVIFTFRDSSEGGHIQIQQEDRFNIYKMFITAKPHYIDIEMASDNKILDELITLTRQNGVKLIFSYHDFNGTVSFEEARNQILNFESKLTQELNVDQQVFESFIYKLIYTANNFDDNLTPLKLCKEISSSKKSIISFCMGSLGIFSRIACIIAGSYLTYAFLEEKTAQGQIQIEKIKQFYDLILD
ncbi:MAG: type I 3-dehydroquinate dehydratase [Candidatus Hermodarchaeota archaeon]